MQTTHHNSSLYVVSLRRERVWFIKRKSQKRFMRARFYEIEIGEWKSRSYTFGLYRIRLNIFNQRCSSNELRSNMRTGRGTQQTIIVMTFYCIETICIVFYCFPFWQSMFIDLLSSDEFMLWVEIAKSVRIWFSIFWISNR